MDRTFQQQAYLNENRTHKERGLSEFNTQKQKWDREENTQCVFVNECRTWTSGNGNSSRFLIRKHSRVIKCLKNDLEQPRTGNCGDL